MTTRFHRGQGHWYVLAAAILWGTTGTAQALAPGGASSMAIGATRLLIGGVALLLFALWRGRFRGDASWPRVPTVAAAVAIAVYQVCFFVGVARTGVAVGTMVAIGSSPILAGILGLVVRGERPSYRWIVATFMAVVGCSLLVTGGGGINVDLIGMLAALGAGGAYASYAVASKAVLDQQHPEAAVAVIFCLGALLLAPLLITSDLHWLANSRGLLMAMHLGLVATALAYTFFARGLRDIPVAAAVTLSLAEPLTAALLGVFLLRERLDWSALVGIALMFAGLAVLVTRSRSSDDRLAATISRQAPEAPLPAAAPRERG